MRAFNIALRRACATILLAQLALFASRVEAQQGTYSADEVKAAFLYRFATYVEWPSAKPPGEAITIAVLGAPPVATLLAAYVPGRTIEGRPVEVRPVARIEDVGGAELVFIGREHSSMLSELVGALDKRPVLIVTEAPDGLAQGAMVNFQIVDQRVRFEISLRNTKAAGLGLSSRLLSAAIRVETARCTYDCRRLVPPPGLGLVRKVASP